MIAKRRAIRKRVKGNIRDAAVKSEKSGAIETSGMTRTKKRELAYLFPLLRWSRLRKHGTTDALAQ